MDGWSGLACAAIPPAPPSDVFQNRGTPPVPPAGAAPPAPCLMATEGERSLTLLHGRGGRFLGCPCTRGEGWDVCPECGGRDGSGDLWWRTPLFHLAQPPTFLGTGGLPLYPRRGLCPLHPAWGDEGGATFSLGASDPLPRLPLHSGVGMGGLSRVRGQGREWGLMVANAIVPPSSASNVFGYRGTRCTPDGGCAPCTLLDGGGGGAQSDLAA